MSSMITITESKDFSLIARLNEEVQNLHATLFPGMFKPHDAPAIEAAMKRMFSDASCRCYLAVQEEQPVGYAVFFIRELPENAFHYAIRTVYIDQICVLGSHRRSGAGKLLMEQAEQLARSLSITRIELDHWSLNTHAAAYFRKNGYQLCKERLMKTTGL